jgi:hypothetical protein
MDLAEISVIAHSAAKNSGRSDRFDRFVPMGTKRQERLSYQAI